MITLVLASVVMTAIYNIFISQQEAYTTQSYTIETIQNFRAANTVMGGEIRLAGYRNPALVATDPDPTDTDCLGTPGVCIGSSGTRLVFTYYDENATDNSVDYDGDGIIHGAEADPSAEMVKVTYDLYAGFDSSNVDDLGRAVGVANRVPTVLNIHGLEFRYLIDNGAGGYTIATSVNAGNMRDVRGVEMTVLAKSSGVDKNDPSVSSFTSPGGTAWTLPAGIQGRMFTTTIMCRNLSI